MTLTQGHKESVGLPSIKQIVSAKRVCAIKQKLISLAHVVFYREDIISLRYRGPSKAQIKEHNTQVFLSTFYSFGM